jgi:DnaJ-domain-containing protein 1
MLLPGRLAATTLGDLFGRLHRGRATGLLELIEVPVGFTAVPGRAHGVHFASGVITAVDTVLGAHRLGDLLRSRGLLDDPGARRLAECLARGDRRPAGEILAAEGLVPRGVVTAALRGQLRSKLDALFRLEDAAVRFRVARPRPHATIPLTPSEFLHGRVRHRDRGVEAAADDKPNQAALDPRRSAALAALGVGDDATPETIRRAFRRLAADLHPDRHAGTGDAERERRTAMFARITAAYHALCD